MKVITHINDSKDSSPWGRNNDECETFDFKKYQFYVNSDIKLTIDNNIYIRFYDYEEEKGKEISYSTIYLTISISSKKYTTHELQEKISKWTREYETENKLYVKS